MNYERPEIQVVRYGKPVRTQAGAEFVNSAGVQCIYAQCRYCHQIMTYITEDDVKNPTPAAEKRINDAFEAHKQVCPVWTEGQPWP